MHTHYPKEAFEKMADYLYKSTDIDHSFVFGESRLGSYDFIHQTRELAAAQEFFEALPQIDKAQIIGDSCVGHEDEMMEHPWLPVCRYLTTWANWRADATEITQQYLKDCAEGKRNDVDTDKYLEDQ